MSDPVEIDTAGIEQFHPGADNNRRDMFKHKRLGRVVKINSPGWTGIPACAAKAASGPVYDALIGNLMGHRKINRFTPSQTCAELI